MEQDYFDVITTPMDFGTICSNLESGGKYMNSEDVYKDVQYIWENCYKYNNKGDYVMELMKRVKKNFAKYWTAAGLYTDHLQSKSLLYLIYFHISITLLNLLICFSSFSASLSIRLFSSMSHINRCTLLQS